LRRLLTILDEGVLQPIARLLVTVGARRRWPAPVALGWVLLTRPVRVQRTRPRHTKGRRIVALYKLGGLEDLIAALEGRGVTDVMIARLQRDDVKRVFREFIDAPLDDFDYRPNDASLDDAKARYRNFLVSVCQRYRRWLGIGAFVAANFGYVAERELAAASTNIGMPFLIIHKESIRTAAQRPIYEAALRDNVGAFAGTAIAVYNETEKASLIRAQIAQPGDIDVIGCPRLDPLHRMRGLTAPDRESAKVIYFAVDPVAGTRTFAPDEVVRGTAAGGATTSQPVRWDRLVRHLEQELVNVARQRPSVEFIIKAKLGRGKQVRARFDGVALPANMSITGRGLAPHYIKSAHIVIGLNTTALLEAIAAGRHVIVPCFEEAALDANKGYLFDLGEAVCTLSQPVQLDEAIGRLLDVEPAASLTSDATRTLSQYLGNPDGGSGDRAYAWILSHLPPK